MKVNNSNHKSTLDLANVAKHRKTSRAEGKQSSAETAGLPPGIGETANVELSSEARAMSRANQMVKAEDIDQAKIDRIKAMIAERKYNPDYGKVADKVVNETLLQDLS